MVIENKFSVLMSVYIKENPQYLEQCLASLLGQTVKPSQVVIVEDGPLNLELIEVLQKWAVLLPIERLPLDTNVGLGAALNAGLLACTYELVARMDTDDICHSERFEKQLKVFEYTDIDICGTWVSEFDVSVDVINSYRKLPSEHQSIVDFSKFKNPLNHPSVMYKKSKVLSVGGYDDVLFFEDYFLWLKLIDAKANFYNIDEALVSMRANLSQLERRSGFRYGCYELSFLRRCIIAGLLSKKVAIRNALIRFPLRLMPKRAIRQLYKWVLRSN